MSDNLPSIQNPDKELVSAVALDIGKEMVAYLEVMYPDVFQVMNEGCKLSIRNHIHNDIMAFSKYSTVREFQDWITRRKIFRRKWLAQTRKNRKEPSHI